MDQPDLDPRLHHGALAGIRRVNTISCSDAIIWKPLLGLAQQSTRRPLRLLDLGSGGGDVMVALAQRAQRRQLELEIAGCDISAVAVHYAQQQAAKARLTNVSFLQLNVLEDPLPAGFDVVTCSLFLHHLSNSEASELLRKMADAARAMVLVNDLRRSPLAWAMAWAGCRLLTSSPIVHVDGPRSVAAAFTASELLSMAERSGMPGAVVTRHWPWRLLLTWRRV